MNEWAQVGLELQILRGDSFPFHPGPQLRLRVADFLFFVVVIHPFPEGIYR